MWLALMFLNVAFTFAIYVLFFFKETYVIKRIRTDFSLVFSCSDAPDRAIAGDVRWLVWENTRLAHLLSPEHWATLFASKIPCCPVFLFSATLHCWVLLAYSWRSFVTVTVWSLCQAICSLSTISLQLSLKKSRLLARERIRCWLWQQVGEICS